MEGLRTNFDAHNTRFLVVTLLWQTINLVFFAIFTEYGYLLSDNFTGLYPFFQDIHVMMFVGFGFLLVFPGTYTLSGVVFNFILGAISLQWAILTNGFWYQVTSGHPQKIPLSVVDFINGDFGVAAVLIAYSAVLGKMSPVQYMVMAFFELIAYSFNVWLGTYVFCVADAGGSMLIHTFAAYFGLAVSFVYDRKLSPAAYNRSHSTYKSDTFTMIGTLFLWMFWPSFNGALSIPGGQHRAVINTVLSLCAACVVTYCVSIGSRGKFAMADIQNASLAGGVAIGAVADMVIGPWAAILIGSVAGGISTVGFAFLQTFLFERIGLHDTAGINNLHGLPGILGGFASIFASLHADEAKYGDSLGEMFPCRMSSANATGIDMRSGRDWTAGRQASFQAATLFSTIGIALISGFVVGFIVTMTCFGNRDTENYFFDNYLGTHYTDVEAPSSEGIKIPATIRENDDDDSEEELKDRRRRKRRHSSPKESRRDRREGGGSGKRTRRDRESSGSSRSNSQSSRDQSETSQSRY